MDRLNAFLKQEDAVLFICGYSFRDDHINERILSALNTNTTAHVFVLYYDIIPNKDATKNGVKEFSFDEDDELAKTATKNHKMSILATKSAVIGGQYGSWSLKRKAEREELHNIITFYLQDEETKESPWTGKGELILPDFVKFVDFLKNMIPKNEWEADESE
jgi:hypothetical protein